MTRFVKLAVLAAALTICGCPSDSGSRDDERTVDTGPDEAVEEESAEPDGGAPTTDAADDAGPGECEIRITEEDKCPAPCDPYGHVVPAGRLCLVKCFEDEECPPGTRCEFNNCFPECSNDSECMEIHEYLRCSSLNNICG